MWICVTNISLFLGFEVTFEVDWLIDSYRVTMVFLCETPIMLLNRIEISA